MSKFTKAIADQYYGRINISLKQNKTDVSNLLKLTSENNMNTS